MNEQSIQKQLKHDFISFLKENNAYKEFIYEYRKYINNKLSNVNFYILIDPFDECEDIYSYQNIIERSFIWTETKHDWKFWDELANKWRMKISNIKF